MNFVLLMDMKSILTLLSLTFALQAGAAIKLSLIHSRDLRAPLLIVTKEAETPQQALQRYLKSLADNPDLLHLFAGQVPRIEIDSASNVTTEDFNNLAILIANSPKDYSSIRPRIDEFSASFARQGLSTAILPIVADLDLTLTDRRSLLELIAKNTKLLVAMGGDDVDPLAYQHAAIWAENTNIVRDNFEISLIRRFVQEGRGYLFGVCRGHQISSVALGYTLIQDVPRLIGNSVEHSLSQHKIKIFKTTHATLHSAQPSNAGTISEVNSLHHQSVKFRVGGPLELAALSEDGVVEALELKNGKGLLLQFHPESMDSIISRNIFREVSSRAFPRLAKSTVRLCAKAL